MKRNAVGRKKGSDQRGKKEKGPSIEGQPLPYIRHPNKTERPCGARVTYMVTGSTQTVEKKEEGAKKHRGNRGAKSGVLTFVDLLRMEKTKGTPARRGLRGNHGPK